MKLLKPSRQAFRVAVLVSVLALGLRLAFVAFYHTADLAGHDPQAYWSFAQSIAAGHGFRSNYEPWLADRPPLYAYFLAANFRVFGEDRTAVFAVQAVIGAAAAGLFSLATTAVAGSFRGLVGGLLFAVFPHFLLFTEQILTEAVYLPLLAGLLAVLLVVQLEGVSWLPALTAGVITGVLGLVRREALLLAGGLTAGLLYLRLELHRRRLVMSCVIAGFAALAVLAPWLLRNWIELGRPVLSSSAGWNFMVGNNPAAQGGYSPLPAEWQAEFQGLTELERDDRAWELALGWVRAEPADFAVLLGRKMAHLLEPAHNLVLDAADLLLLPLYLAGVLRLARGQPNGRIVAVVAGGSLAAVSCVALVFVGGWRYRAGAYPGLLLLAAYGVPQAWEAVWVAWRAQRRPVRAAP